MITIIPSARQQITMVDEFWATEHGGIPARLASNDDVLNWIEIRYNCLIARPHKFDFTMTFPDDKDLTFFLLNHPET